MEILIFSDRKNIGKAFEKVARSKGCSFAFYPVKDFYGKVKMFREYNLFYLDISSVKEPDKKKIFNLVYRTKNARIGILDPDNSVSDVAELFHRGVADYIGRSLYTSGITLKRIQKVYSYRMVDADVPACEMEDDDVDGNYILSGNNWELINPGQEYTFCFMFIELDNFRDMKKTAGVERARIISEAFHKFIGQYVSSVNGRIWIWMEYSGIILFPFDGCRCDAILSSFKLMLNRYLINMVDLTMDYFYSYHIVLHIGNTIYRERGETGTIVSDSINSIFHLGQKYAENQNFYLTREMERFIPAGLCGYFVPDGDFEGRKLLRMKHFD